MKPASIMKLRPGQTGICGPAEASGQSPQHQEHQHQHQHQHSPTPSPPRSTRPAPSPGQPPAGQAAPSPHGSPTAGQEQVEAPEKSREGVVPEVTGQAGPRSPTAVLSATDEEWESRERIRVVVTSPCQGNPADTHTGAHRSILELANPAWTRREYLDAPGQRRGQQPASGTADPRVVKQGKSSGGSVDTTRQSSDPQRVILFSGERPVGAAKGKQFSAKASCQPPPPPPLYTPPPPCIAPPPRGGTVTLPMNNRKSQAPKAPEKIFDLH